MASGGAPLRLQFLEGEVMGQHQFNGGTKGGDSAFQFNSFREREGDHRR
jgi:hypothetical protein